jgi:hypothetical protein
MNRLVLLLVSGCLWAAMMFALFDREIRPYFEYQQPPTYRMMLRDKRHPEMQRRFIYLAAQKIGDVESLLVPLPAGGCVMKTRFLMHMQPFLAMKLPDDRTYVSSEVRVDDTFQLSKFDMRVSILGMPISLAGERRGDKLHVKSDLLLPGMGGESIVDFPRDAILSDNFLPYQGGARLTEGKKWRIRMIEFDNLLSFGKPKDLGFRDVYAVVVGREPVEHRGRDVSAFKVDVRKNANDERETYSLWVDDQGTVLKQLTMINKLACTIVLDESRVLEVGEASVYEWTVLPPRGR